MMAEVSALDEPAYTQDGTLEWDYFLKTCHIVNKYTYLQTHKRVMDSVAERRAILG